MKSRHAFTVLIIINLALLTLQFVHAQPTQPATAAAPILRAQALELVDAHGRVRAELKVMPAQPNFKMSDGTTGFPEAVQLRLITSNNGPNVKLVTTEDGSGLVLGGEKGYVQILSRAKDDPFVKIVTKDGREQVLKP
jgi:hypothetical protein